MRLLGRVLWAWACWELFWILIRVFEDDCYRIFYEERLEWLWDLNLRFLRRW